MTPLPRDGKWRIFHTGHHWWQFPYTIDGPGDIGVALTLWGARRQLRNLKAKTKARTDEAPYWDNPVVYEESS